MHRQSTATAHAEPSVISTPDIDHEMRARTLQAELDACQEGRAELRQDNRELRDKLDARDVLIATLRSEIDTLNGKVISLEDELELVESEHAAMTADYESKVT